MPSNLAARERRHRVKNHTEDYRSNNNRSPSMPTPFINGSMYDYRSRSPRDNIIIHSVDGSEGTPVNRVKVEFKSGKQLIKMPRGTSAIKHGFRSKRPSIKENSILNRNL